MRIFKCLKKASFILIVIIINCVLSFLLEPASGASGRMWSGYYEQEKLDTIFVGSSLCQQTFVPSIVDEAMGVKSYNMGTPSQAVPQSLRAIQVAVEEHGVETVIYGMGLSTFASEPIREAKLTFESERVRKKGGLGGFVSAVEYVCSEDVRATEDSIIFWFPWLYNHESYDVQTIKSNVDYKVKRMETKFRGLYFDDTEGLAKGYRNDDRTIFEYESKWGTLSNNLYSSKLDADMMCELESILEYCNEKGVDLVVMNTPHSPFAVVSCYPFYEECQDEIGALCDKYDVDYYDFSLVKPEVFECRAEYFADYEHLNRNGSEVFSQKLSQFLLSRKNGEDMSNYFYSEDEFFEIHEREVAAWKKAGNHSNK